MCIHCTMITIVKLINLAITSHNYLLCVHMKELLRSTLF